MLKENPLILPVAGGCLLLVLIFVLVNSRKAAKPEKSTKTKKISKKAD